VDHDGAVIRRHADVELDRSGPHLDGQIERRERVLRSFG
jgi:hypothetical protein